MTTNRAVNCTDYIGEGPYLYHVSVQGDDWCCLWMVAGNDFADAVVTALEATEDADDDSSCDGYKIGEFDHDHL